MERYFLTEQEANKLHAKMGEIQIRELIYGFNKPKVSKMKHSPRLKSWCVVVGQPKPNWKHGAPNLSNVGLFCSGKHFDKKEDAERAAATENSMSWSWTYEVFDNRSDDSSVPIGDIIPVASMSQAINNHVCPTCKNNRVSKTENSCWSCGNKL